MSSDRKVTLQFSQMNLDPRIIKAVAGLGWKLPTLIQGKAIPLCLEGQDVLARAKTGSGKTASYCIPAIQRILDSKKSGNGGVKVIVLVPTKELSLQVTRNLKELCSSCSREVSIVGVSSSMNPHTQRTALMEKPDIVVGTPSRILTHLQSTIIDIKESLELLVIDEADLVLSFGYEEDMKMIKSYLPAVYQAILMSATLSEDVLILKRLILNNPIVLKLEEADLPEQSRLTQFYIKCLEEDRYLLIYTLLKLKLVRGKTLLFVNDIQRCYKLKLFLEQFSIKSCVLNSELPHNSRCHIIEQFNSGLYDYVIATDEIQNTKQVTGKKRKRKDREYGVSRGIDFQGVENVVNFDLPLCVDSYIHRVGRTARGFDYGTALTFVSPEQECNFKVIEESLAQKSDDEVKPYKFRMSEIEGFRYRVEVSLNEDRVEIRSQSPFDVLGCLKESVIVSKEARLKELRSEILTSSKLKNHFDENPRDLQVLKHDGSLLSHKVQNHLKYIPPYLVPKVIRTGDTTSDSVPVMVKKMKSGKRHLKKRSKKNHDPLKTLRASTDKSKRPRYSLNTH